MRDRCGEDIWKLHSDDQSCVICITTNGFVKKNGEGVMGAGVALQAASRLPWLPKCLGDHIAENGNHLKYLSHLRLIFFPTKHVWFEKSDMELIKRSAQELAVLANKYHRTLFYLPRPGCSNGKLLWRDVKLVIAPVLPYNVIAVTK